MKLTITDLTSIFAMIVSIIAFIECRRLSRLGQKNIELTIEMNDDLIKLEKMFKSFLEHFV